MTSDEYGHRTATVRFDDGHEDVVLAAELAPAPSRAPLGGGSAPAVGRHHPRLISRDRFAELLADRPVWVAAARRGIEYHHPEPATTNTTCGRNTLYGEILRHGDVVAWYGSAPCRRCYPDGDKAVPLVDGQHPVVLVSKTEAGPVLAEVRQARPDGRLVQVVYLHSGTSAWIAATRIVQAPAAAPDETTAVEGGAGGAGC